MIKKTETYKGQFKTIDTELKAYFLGYAYGDGHNTTQGGYKFIIGTTEEDEPILRVFGTEFPFFKLGTYPSHPGILYLECYEKSFVTDIKKLGMPQHKVKADKIGKFKVPNLREDLLHHFVRGFFDADGSAYVPTRYRSRNNIKVEIGLGTENFCLELKDLLNKKKLNFAYTTRDKVDGNGNTHPSYTIYTSARKDSLDFAEYIYKDATIYLERKKSILYMDYVESALQKRRKKFPLCPVCKGIAQYQGTRNKKLRLRCTKCSKNYSVKLPLIQEIV